ncbi:MAG TPA: TolC family protein [Kofleriaceae bacterium]|nr:TolC family protein [Kofleriaceae bacterium]
MCVLAAPRLAAAAGELTLERAVALAVERNERARIADQDAAVAEAQVDRARAFFFPELTASGSYVLRRDPGMFQDRSVLTGTIAASLTLFDGRGFPLLSAARLEREAARMSRHEVRRQLAVEAATAYLVTLGAQAVVEAARHRVDFARASERDARGRVEAQLTSSNDATRARLELATAQLALRRAEGDLAAARLHLGWLIGSDLDGALGEPRALLSAAAPPAAGGERLDVRAARKRVESAYQLAREPLWRWVPTFSVTGQAEASSIEDVTGKRTDWFVALNAVWALWDGGERSADRAERLARARAGQLGVEQQVRRVALEEQTARVALDTARATAAEAEEAVAAARKNVEEARILYNQGLARAIEVADASARLFDAEVALARERYALGQAVVDLRAARGEGPLGRTRQTP